MHSVVVYSRGIRCDLRRLVVLLWFLEMGIGGRRGRVESGAVVGLRRSRRRPRMVVSMLVGFCAGVDVC